MGYNEANITHGIKTRLKDILKEVTEKFGQTPRVHLTEDEINEKIAVAIAKAFPQFVKNAQIQLGTMTAPGVVNLTASPTGGPVAGTITPPLGHIT